MSNLNDSTDPHEVTKLLKNLLKLESSEPKATPPPKETNGNVETTSSGDPPFDTAMASGGSHVQNIHMSDNDEGVSIPVHGTKTNIYPAHSGSSSSAKLKIKNIVDFGWDHKYHGGKLVALHVGGNYVAYGIKLSSAGGVRVLNQKTNERLLIKGFEGRIIDLCFAHITDEVLLAVTDSTGVMSVYDINNAEGLSFSLLISVESGGGERGKMVEDYHRVVWCRYSTDNDDDDDDGSDGDEENLAKLLVATHGCDAQIWYMDSVIRELGRGKTVAVDEVTDGVKRITGEFDLPITDVAVSPDGTSLTLASLSGEIKFFQASADVESRCLHRWTPQPYKPISSLFFLDNYKSTTPEAIFWEYLVVGFDCNREIKLYNCRSWTCLQTLSFQWFSEPTNTARYTVRGFKAEMDLTSSYLVLSDLQRNVLYMLYLHRNTSHALFTSVAYFRLTLPVVSFVVCDAVRCRFKPMEEHVDYQDVEETPVLQQGSGESDNRLEGTLLKLMWLNIKSLQSCNVIYQPLMAAHLGMDSSVCSLSQDSFVASDHLSDLSSNASSTNGNVGPTTTATTQQQQLENGGKMLMSPGDFVLARTAGGGAVIGSNTGAAAEPTATLAPVEEDATSLSECIDGIGANFNGVSKDALDGITRKRQRSPQSGTSSPSQEVADIMGVPLSSTSTSEEDDIPLGMGGKEGGASLMNHKGTPITLGSRAAGSTSGEGANGDDDDDDEQQTSRDRPRRPTPGIGSGRVMPDSPSDEDNNATASNNDPIDGSHGMSELSIAASKLNASLEHVLPSVTANTGLSNESNVSFANMERFETQLGALQSSVTSLTQLVERLCSSQDDLGRRIEHTMDKKIADTVVPAVSKSVERLCESITLDTRKHITATQLQNKETLMKFFQSPPVMEAIRQASTAVARSQIQEALRDVVQNHVVPSIDRICQSLFAQLHESFQRGLREFLTQVEAYTDGKNAFNQRQEMQKRLQSHMDQGFKSTSLELQQSVKQCLQKSLAPLSQEVGENVGSGVRLHMGMLKESFGALLAEHMNSQRTAFQAIVRDEMERQLRERGAAVAAAAARSGAATPLPLEQQRIAHITNLIAQRNYNEAFKEALNSHDLGLLSKTCSLVDPKSVFEDHHLEQSVLLALVQQLSVNFATHTQVKIAYLHEALLAIETTTPLTREHLPGVLVGLSRQLDVFLTAQPSHKLASQVKKLAQIVKLVQSCCSAAS